MSLSEKYSSNENTKTTFIDEIESNPHNAVMEFIEKNMPIATSTRCPTQNDQRCRKGSNFSYA